MKEMVYKQYDQAELDAQYNLRERHPEFQTHFDWYDAESARARETLDCRLDVAYGDAPLENLDVFPALNPGSPVLVFIHGGYWQGMDKGAFAFPARTFVPAGAAYISVNYTLAPQEGIDVMVAQVRRALGWVHANAPSFNGDPERIHVSGHSAGGHLTGMMLITDWEAEGMPGALVKSGCAISGLFDLEPIRLCYLNQVVGMDAETSHRNSPLYHIPARGVPLVAVVGGEETDEFLRHNGMMATAWGARGFSCEKMSMPGLNHFSVVQELLRPDSPLTLAQLKLLGLSA